MKTLFLIVGMVFSLNAFAESFDDEAPKYMKDSVITVKLKNGKEYKYSGNEWKVVRRGKKKSAGMIVMPKDHVKYFAKKNRVRLMGGIGPGGLKTEFFGPVVKVTPDSNFVGGVGYDRMLNERWSVGGQALSNKTYTLGLGYDF